MQNPDRMGIIGSSDDCISATGCLMTDFRIEKDSLGDVKVPREALYGAQTQRAVENFPVSASAFPASSSGRSGSSRPSQQR